MTLETDSLDAALTILGEVLAERGAVIEIAVIGGGALLLSGELRTRVRPSRRTS